MIDPELQKRFRALLEAGDESHLEYEEKHGDAGAAYCHLVLEDHLTAKNKVVRYIAENIPAVAQDELKAILKRFDQWSFEMEPGHRFTTIDPEKGCNLNSFALEEVENQYEIKVLADELDCEESEVRELVQAEKELSGSDFCIGTLYRGDFDTFYTYQGTDACWFAVLPKEWIQDTLKEIREEIREEAANAVADELISKILSEE